MSWFERAPDGPRISRKRLLGSLDDLAQLRSVEVGEREREDHRQVKLVVLAEVLRERREVRDPRLAEQHPLGVVVARDRTPAPIDLVHFGPVHVVDALLTMILRLPQARVVAQLRVLDQRMRDVDSKAGDATVEPEAECLLELVAHTLVPPVQVGLLGEEVVQVVPAELRVLGPGRPAERRRPVVRLVRPDVPVALRGVREPRMLAARVVGDEVEHDLDPARIRIGDERVEVVQRSVVGMDAVEVGDVVPPVRVRRGVDRRQPDRVDAQPLEVVELRPNALQVAVPVTVRVGEGPDVDLVHDRVAPPHAARQATDNGLRPTNTTKSSSAVAGRCSWPPWTASTSNPARSSISTSSCVK